MKYSFNRFHIAMYYVQFVHVLQPASYLFHLLLVCYCLFVGNVKEKKKKTVTLTNLKLHRQCPSACTRISPLDRNSFIVPSSKNGDTNAYEGLPAVLSVRHDNPRNCTTLSWCNLDHMRHSRKIF